MGVPEKYGLYVDKNPPCLVALGFRRLYEGRPPFTTSLWEMIKLRSVFRKFETLMLIFLYPLKRFN